MLRIEAKIDNPIWGIFLILVAFLFFSFIAASGKWLLLLGLPAFQLVFMRYCTHFIISSSIVFNQSNWKEQLLCKGLLLTLLRALLLVASTAFAFSAFRFLPLTLTATIEFTAPLIICLLSWPLLGEKVGKFRLGAILIGFIGVLIIIKPFNENFHWATLLSLLGAVCFSLYAILSRYLAGKVAVDIMQFYSGLIGTVVTFPFILFIWVTPIGVINWIIMFGMGAFGWLGHQLLTHAHGYAPANLLTPFGYSFIIYNTIWSFFLTGYVPDLFSIIGGLLIVLSGLIIWFREFKSSKQTY